MELTLSVVNRGEAGELRALRDWLANEDDVRTNAKISTHTFRPNSNKMGVGLDLTGLIAGTRFDTASLVVAIASWRETRHSKPTVGLKVNHRIVILASPGQHTIDAEIRELGYDG